PERPHPFRPWSEAPKRNAWRGRAPVGAGSAAPAAGCRSPRRARLLGGDLLADLLERAPDQPRDVHLRDPDLRRDLRLRQPVEEPEAQDRALAVVQHPEARRQDRRTATASCTRARSRAPPGPPPPRPTPQSRAPRSSASAPAARSAVPS